MVLDSESIASFRKKDAERKRRDREIMTTDEKQLIRLSDTLRKRKAPENMSIVEIE